MTRFKMYFMVCLLVGSTPFCLAQQQSKKSLRPQNTIPILSSDSKNDIIDKAAYVVPTANQYAALQNEFIAFVHFGPNTFTKMEWGNGMENPSIFNLKELDTDQWCRAMKAAGMKMVILTVKHHDGFVLWQSRYTDHGIMSSPFQNGKGDILRNLSASCRKVGLKLGIYLSPADLFQIENPKGLYGNLSKPSSRTIPRQIAGRPFTNKVTFDFVVDDYNEYFLNQLFELLTEYGPVHEVWFDGAHPKTKGNQQYDYLAWRKLIRTLAPKAVIFGREDIRWCGNEAGQTRSTEWNVIPYQDNPKLMTRFGDLTAESLGSREDIFKGKFLHYQQAETNTSIREGWFYRDDIYQKVRSVDDVFDIYERSAGGNSTFLLNIPPNREGRFADQDVAVLTEVGKRIAATYEKNLFANASGPRPLLDGNAATFTLLDKASAALTITLPKPQTINRIVLQEAIGTHGERIEKHALDAWINNQWTEIITATNVGYKRILRFPEVTSAKFRVRIIESRNTPALSNVTAHYYQSSPPQLAILRDREGLVHITPQQNDFGWKPHGHNATKNINQDLEIYYTTDGSNPGPNAPRYQTQFPTESQTVRAIAISKSRQGSIAERAFGILGNNWRVVGQDSEKSKHKAPLAFDADPSTYWLSDNTGAAHFIEIDLGKQQDLAGFAYTPPSKDASGMIESGVIKVSHDGKRWQQAGSFQFGNLINDPTRRVFRFEKPSAARFVRIESGIIAGQSGSAAIAELEFFVSD
jgi:alpha-L-fucosidase